MGLDRAQIMRAMDVLASRVTVERSSDGECCIRFEDLDRDGMTSLGIAPDLADRLAACSWWREMVDDVLETPEFCEPNVDPDEVLEYARDVVREYLRKRL